MVARRLFSIIIIYFAVSGFLIFPCNWTHAVWFPWANILDGCMSLEIYLETWWEHLHTFCCCCCEWTQVGFALEYPFIGSLDSEPCTGASKQKALYLEHVLKPTLVQRSGCEALCANFVCNLHTSLTKQTKNSIYLQPSSRARHKYDMDKVNMTIIALCAFYWDGWFPNPHDQRMLCPLTA